MAIAVKAAIAGVVGDKDHDAMWNTICDAIVQYIQTNAVVTGTVVVTSVSSVAAGFGVSGPGAGTLTGVIT